jgi:hypothetical protein
MSEPDEIDELDEIVTDKVIEEKHTEIVFVKKITGSDRIFSNTLSLTEFTQVVCLRADMIVRGAPIYVEPTPCTTDIAIKEIIEGKCILSIVRERGVIYNEELGKNIRYVEVWDVNELKIPQKCISDFDPLILKHYPDIHKKVNDLLK